MMVYTISTGNIYINKKQKQKTKKTEMTDLKQVNNIGMRSMQEPIFLLCRLREDSFYI